MPPHKKVKAHQIQKDQDEPGTPAQPTIPATKSHMNNNKVQEDLAHAYMGSLVVNVHLINQSSANQTLNQNFCERLKESFQHRTQHFTQEDCIHVSMSCLEFENILTNYTNQQQQPDPNISITPQLLELQDHVRWKTSLRVSNSILITMVISH